MNISPYIKSDNNKKSEKIKSLIKKKFDTYNLKKSNLIIVIGGDGFMLNILKKYQKYNLQIFRKKNNRKYYEIKKNNN